MKDRVHWHAGGSHPVRCTETHVPLTEDDVRRVIREELAANQRDLRRTRP